MVQVVDKDIALLVEQLECEGNIVTPLVEKLLQGISCRLQKENTENKKHLYDIKLVRNGSAFLFFVEYSEKGEISEWREINVENRWV